MTIDIDVVTLFPEVFPGPLATSIPGRAAGAWPRPPRRRTTCGRGASAGTAAWTTIRMAAGRA